MVRFRSTRDGLRDIRSAYLFLSALSLALFIMGGISRRLMIELDARELEHERRTLTLCADSLDRFLSAESETDRLGEALRFGNSAAALDCTDDTRNALLALAEELEEDAKSAGVQSTDSFEGVRLIMYSEDMLRNLSDGFYMLASMEYDSAEAARKTVSETLMRPEYRLTFIMTELPLSPPDEQPVTDALERQKKFAAGKARELAAKIFGASASVMKLKETDECFRMNGANYSAMFSKTDGHLMRLVYIRLGQVEGVSAQDAVDLIALKKSEIPERSISSEACGYVSEEIVLPGRLIRAVYDSGGRLCALGEETFPESGDE